MSIERFLIDANSLITPYKRFYPFDFAPGFWTQMEDHIQSGEIAILDLVKREILQGNDQLKSWMQNLEIGCVIDHRESEIIAGYSAILQYIQGERCYKIDALVEWSRETVADPWLIATAAAHNLTIITFETPNKNLSAQQPSKNAKIPDVADTFNVKTEDLFYLMRSLGFSLN